MKKRNIQKNPNANNGTKEEKDDYEVWLIIPFSSYSQTGSRGMEYKVL